MKIAAFFDLDGTLITANSAALWMKRERRHGRVTRRQMTRAAFYLLAYKLGFINMDKVLKKALQTVRGLEEETIRQWTHAWFHSEVEQFAAPGGLAAIEEHRSRGELVVLHTSASRYESEAACEFFKMDAFLCTRYKVEDGRFTGDFVRPMCYGEGKVAHAERFAEANGVDLDRSYFYTDSITDLPMLRRVSNPRVVNPDPRLKRRAKRRGWPILAWEEKKT